MAERKESYWAKVLFREFIAHYIALDDAQAVADIRNSILALTRLDASGDSFGSKMVKWAEERRGQYPSASENGSMGGRPRKDGTSRFDTAVKAPDQLVYGDNENVFLTEEQHSELARRIGNVNELKKLIDNFSNSLADGSRKSSNHYATLCNWISYRKEREEKGTPSNQIRFEDWNDRTARIYSQTRERLNGGKV